MDLDKIPDETDINVHLRTAGGVLALSYCSAVDTPARACTDARPRMLGEDGRQWTTR